MDSETGQVVEPPTPPTNPAQKPGRVLAKELNLFQLPPINNSFIKRQWCEHQPSFVNDKSAVEFNISGSGTQYTDLSNTYLKVQVRIKEVGGQKDFEQIVKRQNVENNHSAIPVDNILHSLWSDVQVKLNGSLVSTSNTNYAYKAYIEKILKFNSMAKEKQLIFCGFSGDKGYMDQCNVWQPPFSKGLSKRWSWMQGIETKISRGKEATASEADEDEIWPTPTCVEYMGPLMADICQQDRLILNGVNMDFKFIPQEDKFRLITFPTGTKAEIHLDEIKLMVCRVTLANETFLGVERILPTMPVVYPFSRTDVRTFNINAGQYEETYEDLFQGEVPSKMIVGMVKSKSYSGSFDLNPFRFRPFDIHSMGFYVDDESVPRQPFEFNVRDCGYLEGLQSLYEVTGKWGKNTDLDITRETYRQGFFLVGFDVDGATAPNLTSYVGETKSGRTRLKLKFKKALSTNITVIVYAAFQEVAQIDKARNVSLRERDRLLYGRSR